MTSLSELQALESDAPVRRERSHWPSILTLGCVLPGAGLFLIGALVLGVMSLASAVTDVLPPTETLIGAGAAGFEGLLLLWLAWLLFQRARGALSAPERELIAGIPRGAGAGLGALAIAAGALITVAASPWISALLLPLLTVVAVAAPLVELCAVGVRSIPLGPRWRAAAMLGLGMTLVPLVIIVAEAIILAVFVVAAAVWLSTQPAAVRTLFELQSALERESDLSVIAELVTPLVFRPAVLASILAYVAVFVPPIEELLKPLGVWIFARSIQSPRQGFAMGAICGAAYALVESLGVGARGGVEWALAVGVRVPTGLLHVTNSALMGWAIVSAIQDRKLARLAATFALVALIHGIWNASAVGVAVSMLGGAVAQPAWLPNLAAAGSAALIILLAGMFMLLRASNSRLLRPAMGTSVSLADAAARPPDRT